MVKHLVFPVDNVDNSVYILGKPCGQVYSHKFPSTAMPSACSKAAVIQPANLV